MDRAIFVKFHTCPSRMPNKEKLAKKNACPRIDAQKFNVSNEQKRLPWWLFRGFVGDEKLPSYVGNIVNHW